MNTNLNGSIIKRSADGSTIFVKLPRTAWREIDGGCSCDFCKKVPGRKAYWDTLAISKEPTGGLETAWTVHQPEGHPEALHGREVDADGTEAASSAA
jgi:hypothetical protein